MVLFPKVVSRDSYMKLTIEGRSTMKITFSIKADDIQSSANIQLTLESALYWEAKAKINALSEELNRLNNNYLAEMAVTAHEEDL
jgi:hypothetical protein